MNKKQFNINKNYDVWNDKNIWIDGGEEWSEHFGTTDNLWDTILYPKIGKFIKGNVLEIAPGHGRITRKLLESDINLDIIDLSDTCIEKCRERFDDKIDNYYVGNGSDLKDVRSNSKDFVISFDSFVHMSKEVIDSYLNEIYRILKPGGYCWIHHSNIVGGQDDNFNNWAGRSNFNIGEFKILSNKYLFKLISQELINWEASNPYTENGTNPDWLKDGLSLIMKPSNNNKIIKDNLSIIKNSINIIENLL